ncbi:MAG: TetR family transcriptional regulator [Alphaproteobacteria bacterium]
MGQLKKSSAGRPKGQDVENAARRKKQLLNAAIASIAVNGLSSTTLGTFARESGLSQGMVTFYFHSKDALIDEAFRMRMEEYKTICMAALETAENPADRLIAFAFASLDPNLISSQNLMFWNAVWPEASKSKSLQSEFEVHDAKRQAIILSLCDQAKGMLAGTHWTPKSTALAVENMIEGICVRLHYSASQMSIREVRIALGTLLSTIFPLQRGMIMASAEDSGKADSFETTFVPEEEDN